MRGAVGGGAKHSQEPGGLSQDGGRGTWTHSRDVKVELIECVIISQR